MRLLIITQKVDARDQLLGFFIDWINRLALKFDKINILCLEKGEFSLPSNVKVISLGKDRGASKPAQLFNFYKNIFKNDYDAVFVHMNPIWVILGGPTWKIMHKKIYFWYTHKAVTPKLRLAEKFADVILTASKESFRLQSRKVIVTGHGIDTELFKPDPRLSLQSSTHHLRLLSVGRIAPVKNYEVLFEAAEVLKNEGFDFHITIAGEAVLEADNIYESQLKSDISHKGLSSFVTFVGRIDHNKLPDLYRQHGLFIHMSKTGSLDKALLEAMSSGCNVLSSNDAARSFLPSENIFSMDDAIGLAFGIKITGSKPVPIQLREYVIEHHNLGQLIKTVANYMDIDKMV